MFIQSTPQPQPSRASLVREAQDCRRHAVELAHRPEGPFLLRLAAAFEELAEQQGRELR